ncbi:MAG: hypothetical protein A2Z83_02595 [Omnitrophica bacterium GWA2_52_8]|nr:MAG: hypothetical protein A2Z83_02595 [Omnitrophica bacterium GWA2_52_8]
MLFSLKAVTISSVQTERLLNWCRDAKKGSYEKLYLIHMLSSRLRKKRSYFFARSFFSDDTP